MNRVLIVNDSRFECFVLENMLNQLGYHVQVTDEFRALGQMEKFMPDIVLANYIMKETTGDRLIASIHTKHPDVRCYLTSSSQINTAQLNNNGIAGIIKTPVERAKLEAVLNSAPNNDESDQKDQSMDDIRSKLQHWKAKATSELQQVTANQDNHEAAAAVEVAEAVVEAVAEALAESFHFCPSCGKKLPEKDEKYAFCPFCGHRL